MYDIFLTEDVRKLVKGKSIVFLGDSNIRALYKDFLCLLHSSKFIPAKVLKNKMENTVYGDNLVTHGRRTNGRCYREEREALVQGDTRVSFFFLTRVYDDYVESVLERITRKSNPDVIIINSCVWDITRWGCNGVHEYKENLTFLMKKFSILFPNCLVIWITTPPMAAEVKGGFLVKELQFLKYSLRFHVVEANHFARKVVVENGFDVLDTHFHLQMQIHRRYHDGIHWDVKAVRYITNLILRHISLSWNVPLPHRYVSSVVDENLLDSVEDTKDLRIIKLGMKKNSVDIKHDPSKDLNASEHNEKLKSIVTLVNQKEETKKKRRGSIQLYRVPKREESIHNQMAKAELKARHERIRKWTQPSQGDSSQSCDPNPSSNYVKKKNRNRRRKKTEANLSKNSIQPYQQSFNTASSSSSVHYSESALSNKSFHSSAPLLTNPNNVPLLPYSPGYQQSHNSHMQSDESQLQSYNRSNELDSQLISSPSQLPHTPYNPAHHQTYGSFIGRSVHFDFPVISSPSQISCASFEELNNVPPQRRVVDYQTSSWTKFGCISNGNNASLHSRPALLTQQFLQRKRVSEVARNSVRPYEFPHVAPWQTLQPRFDFVNDEIPQIYLF